MRNAKTFIILLLVTVAVAGAAFLLRDQSVQTDLTGELLFPGLLERINDTAKFTVESGAVTMTFEHDGDRWGISERSGYPADQESVRELLLGLTQLKRIEAKTSNPERYEEIGLGDPAAEDSAAVRVVVTDTAGSVSADLIVGDRKFGRGSSTLAQLYVRRPEDPQSWLVEGNLPDQTEFSDWLETELLSLDRERIRAVRVSHEDGETVAVSRSDQTQQDYTLEGLGESEQTTSSYDVNSVATTFAELELEDVQAEEAGKEYPAPTVTAALATFDGLAVSMDVLELDGRRLVRLSAAHDPASATATEPETAAATDGEAAAETAAAGAASGEDGQTEAAAGEDEPSATEESPAQQAAALNARWQGWLYEVADYQLDAISKRRADLVAVPETAEEKPEGSS